MTNREETGDKEKSMVQRREEDIILRVRWRARSVRAQGRVIRK